MKVKASSPFGGETRTRLLVALRLLDESYPRELARLLGVSLSSVQQAVRGLERDGLVPRGGGAEDRHGAGGHLA